MEIIDLLFDKHPHPIIIYDAESLDILKVNSSAVEKYGYSRQEFKECSLLDIRPESKVAELRESLEWEADKKIMDLGTVSHITKSGDTITVNLTVQSFEWDGRDARLVSIRDVSDYHHMQEELERKNKQLSKAQELAEVGWWELNPVTGEVYWSDKLYELLKLKRGEIEGELDFRSYVHPQDLNRLDEAKEKLQNTDEPVEYKLRMKRSDDQYIYMQCRAQSQWNQEGEIELIRGVAQDVTKETETLMTAQLAEKGLKEQRSFLDKLIANVPDIFLLMDAKGEIVRWNNLFEKKTGYDGSEIENYSAVDFFAEEERAALWRTLQDVLDNGHGSTEADLVTPDNERIPHVLTCIRFEYQEQFYVVGIGVDISDRIEYEHRLEEKSRRLTRAEKIARLGHFEWDVQQDDIDWSEVEYDIYGLEAGENAKPGIEQFFNVIHPEDREFVENSVQNILDNKEFEAFEHRIITPAGEEKFVRQRGSVETDSTGEADTVFGTTQDITQLKSAEANLKESLHQKEILLREIHHRVKNNLAIISGLLEFEAMNWADNDQVKRAFKDSQLRIQSIANVHEKLYESDDLANLSFQDYAEELVHLIADNFKQKSEDVEITVESDGIELNVNQAIPTALFINELVTNAFEHAFENEKSGKIEVYLHQNGDTITLTIADNGQGLSGDFEHIVKESDGLGFTLVEQLVKQLHGDLHIEQDGGARFVLQFEKSAKSGSGSDHFG